jgi:hypothetical protein
MTKEQGSRDEAIDKILDLLHSYITIRKDSNRQEAKELARNHEITALELIERKISLEPQYNTKGMDYDWDGGEDTSTGQPEDW